MKLNKLAYVLSLALAVSAASCTTDKEWEEDGNSASGTQVGFSSAAYTIKENKGLVQIPIVCSGDQNGRVSVCVNVEAIDGIEETEPAVEDTHYVITSKNVNIGSETQEAFVEIKTVDDLEINNNRVFKLTLTDAKGATLGENSSCIVTLKDNDSEFYEKLQGSWTMTSVHCYYGTEQSWDVQIVGYDEGEEGYNEVLYIVGINGVSYAEAELDFYYDKNTKEGHLEIPFGSLSASDLYFSSLGGTFDCYIGTVDGNYISFDGLMKATWSEDFNTITFEKDIPAYGWLVSGGQPNGYYWYSFKNPVLTRK